MSVTQQNPLTRSVYILLPMHKVLLLSFLAVSFCFSLFSQTTSPTLTTTYFWDVNTATWIQDVRHRQLSPLSDQKSVTLTEKWDADAESWIPHTRHIKRFDDAGNLLIADLQRWNGSFYFSCFQQEMTYAPNGELQGQVDSRWDRSTNTLLPYQEIVLIGGTQRRIKFFKKYNRATQNWDVREMYREEFGIDGQKLYSLKSVWQENAFQPITRESRTYDDSQNLETVTLETKNKAGEWKFSRRTYFRRGNQGEVRLKTTTKPIPAGKRIGQAISTTESFTYSAYDQLISQVEQTRNTSDRSFHNRILEISYDDLQRKTEKTITVVHSGIKRPLSRTVYSYQPLQETQRHPASTINQPVVTISPNPMNHSATVVISPMPLEELTLALYDISGKIVHEQYISPGAEVVINRNDLAAGMYVYQLRTKNGNPLEKMGKLMVK